MTEAQCYRPPSALRTPERIYADAVSALTDAIAELEGNRERITEHGGECGPLAGRSPLEGLPVLSRVSSALAALTSSSPRDVFTEPVALYAGPR